MNWKITPHAKHRLRQRKMFLPGGVKECYGKLLEFIETTNLHTFNTVKFKYWMPLYPTGKWIDVFVTKDIPHRILVTAFQINKEKFRQFKCIKKA